MNLQGKKVIVGVTGGIAAYKAAALIRLLKVAGADVYPIMTEAAKSFIGALTLQALSGHPALSNVLEPHSENGIEHITLASQADLVIIAPATANTLAKIRAGFADNLLTSVVLASTCPIIIAPAMNKHMLEKPATQENIHVLKQRGFVVVGPDSGFQACGEVGNGRMSEPEFIFEAAEKLFSQSEQPKPFAGKKVIITAGPTVEYIDPVRYISNRSSGKMGYALAEAAHAAGGEVILISGPVTLPPPKNITTIRVTTADEMFNTVKANLDNTSLFIACAAVADFKMPEVNPQKIKKTAGENSLTLTLVKNPDILAHVGHCANRPDIVVGFAAETNNLEDNALKKLNQKGADYIFANDVSSKNTGFNSEYNQVSVYTTQGPKQELGPCPKTELAMKLIELLGQHQLK